MVKIFPQVKHWFYSSISHVQIIKIEAQFMLDY